MVERPILFSGPMVRALLAGTKTQTRRLLNPQPSSCDHTAFAPGWYGSDFKPSIDADGVHCAICGNGVEIDDRRSSGVRGIPVRYVVGDRLYVREAWRCNGWASDVATIMYRASEGGGYTAMTEKYPVASKQPQRVTGGWRPGIHMPRWASRLTLAVTEVRLERLQSCSIEDAKAEGIPEFAGDAFRIGLVPDDQHAWHEWDNRSSVENYRALWGSLNADRGYGWETNPWVVAVSFTVERGNIDAAQPLEDADHG